MAEKDISQKILESYNDVFADIVNVLLFEGRQVIRPEELEDQAPRSAYRADGKLREQERDVAKRWTKNNIRIACVGLENQSEPDPDMPLRVIGYDGAEYRAQLTREARQNPRYPVVTLVLYFGHTKHWDKALSLRDAVEVTEEFRLFVPDYRINLFEIAWLSREQVRKFRSDFRIVADFFVQKRESGDYTPSRERIKHVQETLQLLSVMTGDRRFEEVLSDSNGKGGEQTMCEVLDKIEARGAAMGEARGIAMGEARGIAMGEARGIETANLANIRSLMDNLKFDARQAMDALNIPAAVRAEYEEKLKRS